MKVSVQYAQEHLEDLLDTATRGGEIEITRADHSAFRLALVKPAPQTGKRVLGAGRGELLVPSWEEWQAMDEKLAREMNDSPLLPPDSK